MDPAVHRRIELQSPEDLTYLINNVRRAAADSINAAFPPVEGTAADEDELRSQIEQLVEDYIRRTFTLAFPNLSINGLPITNPSVYLSPSPGGPSDPNEPLYEYEPFDSSKRERIESLIAQEEDLLRTIASLKRRAPQAASARWAEASLAGIQGDEELSRKVCERVEREGEQAGRKVLEGLGELERQVEVEGRYREAVETLGRLKREMGNAVAKMERARVAAGYVTGEGKGGK